MGTTHFDFTGRRVVVTDGTRGLGLGVARAFADSGAEVIVTGPRSRSIAADADLAGIEQRRLDLTDADALAAFATSFNRLDVLVNAAGLILPTAARERPALVRTAVASGLVGPVGLTSRLHPALSAGRDGTASGSGGVVVHTHALRAWFAFARGAGSAQASLISHTARQAIDWQPDGIRVNAIAADGEESVDDFASAVLFLASDAAAAVHGQVLTVRTPRPALAGVS